MESAAVNVLTFPEKCAFFVLLFAAIGIAFRTVRKRIFLVRSGRRSPEFEEKSTSRFKRFLLYVPGQWCNIKNLSWNDLAGLQHIVLFWGVIFFFLYYFVFLIIGEGFGILEVLQRNFVSGLFLRVTEIFGLLILVALAWGFMRRTVLKPARLGPDFEGSAFFLITLSGYVLIICFFSLDALRFNLRMIPSTGFVAGFVAELFWRFFSGLDEMSCLYHLLWWIQGLLIAGFIVYVPFSQHQHAIFSPYNIFVSPPQPKATVAAIALDDAYNGLSRPEDFTRKQLLELYACTQCGRCQDVCPAQAAGKPLSPKKIIQDLRIWLDCSGEIQPFWKGNRKDRRPAKPEAGQWISDEELWSCTTCMACLQSCPAMISSLDKIMDLRRDRVLAESRFFPEVINLFRDVENFGDTFGKGKALREDWLLGRNLKVLSEENEAEVLFWVGCQATFHDRNRMGAIALADLLDRCGIDVAILGKQEVCCGDPMRRLGNEYLYQLFARKNIKYLKKLRFKTIIASCPHCFNALKNEYPQFGGKFEVLHYTEFLKKVVSDGVLELKKALSAKVIYHDPCYLARGNGISEEPRDIIEALPGATLLGTEHSGTKTLCCGGGGGNMWMRELGGMRINELRVKELVQEEPEMIITSCPYCLVMLEDGVKSLQLEPVKCKELAEVIRDLI